MSDEPTQPMEPTFFPPHPSLGWTYEVDLSRQTGCNVYQTRDVDVLVIYIDDQWLPYDPENNMYWNEEWLPLKGGGE